MAGRRPLPGRWPFRKLGNQRQNDSLNAVRSLGSQSRDEGSNPSGGNRLVHRFSVTGFNTP